MVRSLSKVCCAGVMGLQWGDCNAPATRLRSLYRAPPSNAHWDGRRREGGGVPRRTGSSGVCRRHMAGQTSAEILHNFSVLRNTT